MADAVRDVGEAGLRKKQRAEPQAGWEQGGRLPLYMELAVLPQPRP